MWNCVILRKFLLPNITGVFHSERPVDKTCPECDRPYLVERSTKRDGRQLICDSESCGHSEAAEA